MTLYSDKIREMSTSSARAQQKVTDLEQKALHEEKLLEQETVEIFNQKTRSYVPAMLYQVFGGFAVGGGAAANILSHNKLVQESGIGAMVVGTYFILKGILKNDKMVGFFKESVLYLSGKLREYKSK